MQRREAADLPQKVAALVRSASSLAASREVYVEVVHDERRRLVLLRASPSKGGPYTELGPEHAVKLPPGANIGPSGFSLRFGPNGLLESPALPLSVGSRTLEVSRWGEVVVR